MSRLDRAREAFSHPRVTVLDMPCGAMALSGSTRMQSTTIEQLICGAALETALCRVVHERIGQDAERIAPIPADYTEAFSAFLDALEQPESVSAIASYIEFEEQLYRAKGLVTYFADDFLLDILCDTTERSPTFSLPPFRKYDDMHSPQSWAFVKNPNYPTPEAWRKLFGRASRCISWTRKDYEQMGAAFEDGKSIPQIDQAELMKFRIGNEDAPERRQTEVNAAVWIGRETPGDSYWLAAEKYYLHKSLVVGPDCGPAEYAIPYCGEGTPLRLFEHLSIKLVMNTVSTGTMVRMGRVVGNWMAWLDVSNKKLIDRSIRIISDQCSIPYREACIELFITLEEMENETPSEKQSPVQRTILRLKKGIGAD